MSALVRTDDAALAEAVGTVPPASPLAPTPGPSPAGRQRGFGRRVRPVVPPLLVIAAVVVGGTSISGGEGNVLKTLIGALIIAVIQNGMNLTGIASYPQKTVLGLVILAAVLLDTLKRKGFLRLAPG